MCTHRRSGMFLAGLNSIGLNLNSRLNLPGANLNDRGSACKATQEAIRNAGPQDEIHGSIS
jgi:hypothetical protein